jgi:hypothetical protein
MTPLRARRRWLPAVAAALFVLAAAEAGAQRVVRGAGVRLEVRPRPGDTIRTRLDQTVQMTGTMELAEGASSKTVVTTMVVFGRVVPQRREGTAIRVLSLTDSLDVRSSGGRAAIDEEALRRALVGRQMHLLLAPDGSTQLIEEPLETSSALRALVAQMPPTLPNHVVKVGDSWQQVMAIPVAGDPTGTQAGELTTTFRLDSLADEGRIAWISLRGAITRDSSATPLPPGATYSMTGEVVGRVQIDRRLGWITDSRATIVVRSVLTPPPDSGDPTMRFLMKITQRLRASR